MMNHELFDQLLDQASDNAFEKLDELVVADKAGSSEHWHQLGRMDVFECALETSQDLEWRESEANDALLVFLHDFVRENTLVTAGKQGSRSAFMQGQNVGMRELDEILDLVWLDADATRR